MMVDQWKSISTAGLFIVMMLSGYWLSRSEKPYSVLVLTLHKLVAVGTAVFLAVPLIRAGRAGDVSAAVLSLGAATGLFFLSLIVTGGLLSSEVQTPPVVSTVHRIAPYLTLVGTIVTLYL